MQSLKALTSEVLSQEEGVRQRGRVIRASRSGQLGKMSVRTRLDRLLDEESPFLELGLWAGYQMYEPWGEVPAAGVVTGVGMICGRACMVVANDASVKAGAFFPQTVKKVLRAQRIAFRCRLPLVYLVDSAGVFLPLQDEIFPDEDDFGRIFRNNAVLSAAGIPQYAAIMGNCVAGGAYLPVLCDTVVMTDQSKLYLAGPALVKAAVGQDIDGEQLGGARMHAQVSGTVDFRESDDRACLERLRSLIELLPDRRPVEGESAASHVVAPDNADDLYDLVDVEGKKEYDVLDLLRYVVDRDTIQQYKSEYGRTLVTVYARIGGHAVGIVANQRIRCKSSTGELQMGGVLYPDAVEKAARFIRECNQASLPLVFFQDVQGFMVGREAEQSGIIQSGAKLVRAVSTCVVPKITVIVGGSFGAGNYALCGKAFDPWFIFAWPNARYAVMGPHQAADTLLTIQKAAAKRQGKELSADAAEHFRETTTRQYQAQSDIRYGAARGWVDAIIAPHRTREVLLYALSLVDSSDRSNGFHTSPFHV